MSHAIVNKCGEEVLGSYSIELLPDIIPKHPISNLYIHVALNICTLCHI